MPRDDLQKPGGRTQNRQQITLPTRFTPLFLRDCDARLGVVQQIRKRTNIIKSHCGGDESIQRSLLCSRLAFLSIWLETLEVEALTGDKDFNAPVYCQSLNTVLGILRSLGLDKKIKTVTDLQSYLKEKEEKRSAKQWVQEIEAEEVA